MIINTSETAEETKATRNTHRREYLKAYRKRMKGEQLEHFRRAAAERSLRYRQRDPGRWKEIKRRNYWKFKLEVITKYGRICACCGEEQMRPYLVITSSLNFQ